MTARGELAVERHRTYGPPNLLLKPAAPNELPPCQCCGGKHVRQFFSREVDDEKAAFIGVDFHSEKRVGPALLGGVVRYKKREKIDHWIVNVTARLPGYEGYFKPGPSAPMGLVVTHTPTDKGRSRFPGVEEVRHIEVPLSDVGDLERLGEFVRAISMMRAGDDAGVDDFFKTHELIASIVSRAP